MKIHKTFLTVMFACLLATSGCKTVDRSSDASRGTDGASVTVLEASTVRAALVRPDAGVTPSPLFVAADASVMVDVPELNGCSH